MKKLYICILLFVMVSIPLTATEVFDTGWDFNLLDGDFFYPNYIADPFSSRFSADSRTLSINEIALDSDERLDITVGSRFSLFSFRKQDNPDVGAQLDLWVTIPMFMEGGSNDLLEMDGIYSVGLVLSPADWITARISRHHICTHAGDEIDTAGDGDSSIDYDPTPNLTTSAYVRDDFGISVALKPLNLLDISWMQDMLLLYSDFYYFWPGEDWLGVRQIKPARDAYTWFTVGAELKSPEFYTMRMYSAFHVSFWQELSWMPSYSLDFGLEIPGAIKGMTMRLGLNYYDGRSLMNNFYASREQFTGIYISIDR
jgi:hypothetical protein